MSIVEKEIRLEVNDEQIERIRSNTELIAKKDRMIDITCGKYGFDSLSKVGYICRVRAENGNYKLEIKKYLDNEKSIEQSLDIDSVQTGIEFLSLLEMTPYLVLDRYREIRKYNDLLICIDKFQNNVGNYVEIEYQKSDRKEAIKFIDEMGIEFELKEKYGDIIKSRLKEDEEFAKSFSKILDNYKNKL